MSDEWTWEDRQDTLDYRQWKAEQDAERAYGHEEDSVVLTKAQHAAMIAEVATLRGALSEARARVAELEAQEQSGILWVPLDDGMYTAEREYRFGPTAITITGDLVEVANTNFRLRDDFRLCRRIDQAA